MKVAVCVSGAFTTGNPRGDLVRNNALLKSKFPSADFYYATWDNYKDDFEKALLNDKCEYYAEPIIDYHPYKIPKEHHITSHYQPTVDWVMEGGAERLRWTSHHTKQILIHAWLLDTIKKDYDIIVRARYDIFISKYADFSPYLKDTFENHRANCFAATKPNKFNELNEFDTSTNSRHHYNMQDQIIIHNSDAIDTTNVMRLHEEQKLHAAEYGWYQVISMPHGSNHRSHDGWVAHDKRVLDKFLHEKT